MEEKILITGANGQLGSVLANALIERYGSNSIIATDLKHKIKFKCYFEVLDATDYDGIQTLVRKYSITQIYHMAAILSATGEKRPHLTWDVNMETLFNVLEVSRLNNVKKVFFPSSIAVYGADVPKTNAPQNFATTPNTVYGISKVAGELWANYYFNRYGLDVRSIRYPGVIGYQSLPGGGTTDYAVEIYHKAINQEPYECFLNKTTTLPMIYMEDAIRATIELMEAPLKNLSVRTSYNIAGLSFNPEELASSIKEILPEFQISYKPDFRQDIANSWPESIDDSKARQDWNWKPKYNLKKISVDMIKNLQLYYNYKTQKL